MSLSHLLRSGIKHRKIRRQRDSIHTLLLKDVILPLKSGLRANKRGRHITQAAARASSRAQKFQLIGLALTDCHVERSIKRAASNSAWLLQIITGFSPYGFCCRGKSTENHQVLSSRHRLWPQIQPNEMSFCSFTRMQPIHQLQ